MAELFSPAELEVAILASLDGLHGRIPSTPGTQLDEFRQENVRQLIKPDALAEMLTAGDSRTEGENWTRRTTVFGPEGKSLLSTEATIQGETPRRVGIVDGIHTDDSYSKADRITSIFEGGAGEYPSRRTDVFFYPGGTVLAFNDFTGEWHGDDPGVGFTLDGTMMTPEETRRLRNR